MGAWIEIHFQRAAAVAMRVAPLVGAWIEMNRKIIKRDITLVAPLVGAWIEIISIVYLLVSDMSLPLWERGLKSRYGGAELVRHSRSPCGSVD